MARRSKYSAAVVERITKAIAVGATYELAAKYAGISYETFNLWRKAKPQFLQAIEKAEGEAAARWLGRIEQAAKGDDEHPGQWQAAAWKLERRYPREYGRTVVDNNVNLKGDPKAPLFTETIVRLHVQDEPVDDR